MLIRRSFLACGLVSVSDARANSTSISVYAAVSLNEALRDFGRQWQEAGQAAPRFILAASSTLARQIEQGAPADLFLSADEEWMDFAVRRDLVVAETRRRPIGNALVLIAPSTTSNPIRFGEWRDLLPHLGAKGRLAIADPAHVPAGRYAEAALRSLGQWSALEARMVRTENVRAALLLVERGEVPLGIVYATDAAAASGVRIVALFPSQAHPPITYSFALTRMGERKKAAAAFLDFLAGPHAAGTWRRHHFTFLQ